jgi:osmotically-inducible protein OsmY
VSTCNLRLRAASTASSTFGVIAVTDWMVVQKTDLPDEALRVAVLDAIGAHAGAPGLEGLVVTVEDSVATLDGTAPGFFARIKAEEAAGTVFGVTRIVNRLRPRDVPSGTDDESIARAVVSYLGDPVQYTYPSELEVSVEDGVVTLSGGGRVHLALRQAAMMAELVGGVKKVVQAMRVDPGIEVDRPRVSLAAR